MNNYIPADKYVKTMFEIESDLLIWKHLVEKLILEYEYQSDSNYELFASIFSVYDIDNSNEGLLKTYFGESKKIKISNLDDQKKIFFRWVMNLSLLRAYNTIEIFITLAMIEQYLNKDINSGPFKELSTDLNKEIKEYFVLNSLGRVDTKNNRHIIEYLCHKSNDIDKFLSQKIRVDLNTNWKGFFELISILRNIVAHNGMMLNPDTLNNIKSNSKDVYERYFSNQSTDEGAFFLSPNQEQFLNVFVLMNDFAINLVKFIKKEPNLNFMSFN